MTKQCKSPRLKDYDYSENGAYFVTILTHKRQSIFGHVDEAGVMHLSQFGRIVWDCWNDLPNHYANIELDAFVVMPNHVHAIICLITPTNADVREGLKPSLTPKQHGLPEIVRALKTFSSRRINEIRQTKGTSVWHRSFHDRIIRNEVELNKLREYTLYNPSLWARDRYYSD